MFWRKELHSSLKAYNLSENMIFAMGNQFPEWAPYIKVNFSMFFSKFTYLLILAPTKKHSTIDPNPERHDSSIWWKWRNKNKMFTDSGFRIGNSLEGFFVYSSYMYFFMYFFSYVLLLPGPFSFLWQKYCWSLQLFGNNYEGSCSRILASCGLC